MKEVKSPKKPLIYYYLIVIGVILLFNMIITPLMVQSQIVETDYSTFVKDELAKFLYEKETITGEEFMEILEGGKQL